jgi:iron complex transport system substrate-binding protein
VIARFAIAASILALAWPVCARAAETDIERRMRALIEAPPTLAPQFLGETKRGTTAKRIVTVAPSVTEMIFALGHGASVVGVSRYDEQPSEVRALPRVGGFLDPNVEAIVALKPDLVVGVPNAGNRPALERVAKLGVPVFVVPGNSLADVFHAARALAPVLGGEAPARAEKLLAQIERELASLARAVAEGKPPKVAFVYGWTPLVLAGPGSFADALLGVLNGKNVVTAGTAYPQYAVEKLIEDQPDVIIDASEAHTGAASPWMRFPSLAAVKSGRVHNLRLGDVLLPGPRIVRGMRLVAALLHPDRVESPRSP